MKCKEVNRLLVAMGGGGDVARPPDAVNKLAAELVALFALLPVVVLLQVGSRTRSRSTSRCQRENETSKSNSKRRLTLARFQLYQSCLFNFLASAWSFLLYIILL